MKTKKNNIISFDDYLDKSYGKRGTKKREKFEAKFENFKIGVLLQEARKEKGLTQEQVAAKCGTTKSYISKIENDVKEVRIGTLQRIIELGLGGHLNISIRF